jgi:hypothetical protein
VFVSQSLSQPEQQGQRRQRGQGADTQGAADQAPGARQFDPEQMRQRTEQRYQRQLGATDEQWKELGPLVMKVQELNQQLNISGRGGMFGGGRRGAQGDQPGGMQGERPGGMQGARGNRAGMPGEQTALAKASEQLNTLLDDSSATPEKIKEQLTALRTAKENTKKELVTAQKELQKKVTMRQEAQLVLMGMLD